MIELPNIDASADHGHVCRRGEMSQGTGVGFGESFDGLRSLSILPEWRLHTMNSTEDRRMFKFILYWERCVWEKCPDFGDQDWNGPYGFIGRTHH
jgi:hypothetical protein